jgi:hypothetical protein
LSPRTHSVTRSGRAVKGRSDMFQNFTPLQQTAERKDDMGTNEVHSPHGNTSSIHDPSLTPDVKYLVYDDIMSYTFTQYSLCHGLKKSPNEAKIAAMAEMKQLHDMNVFQPVNKSDLISQEVLNVLSSLMFIKEKSCGRFKARACADRRPQRLIYNNTDASFPTVKTESVILTSVIDSNESRFVGVYDIPGAFLHSKLDEFVHIKVTGSLAKYLEMIALEMYDRYITLERDREVIYLLLTRVMYRCLKSVLQF